MTYQQGRPTGAPPGLTHPGHHRQFRRDILQEPPEDQEYNIKLEEPNTKETPSPLRERETRRTIRQEPLKYLDYNIKMEEPNSWETRRVEGLGGVKRPVGDTQKKGEKKRGRRGG